MDIMRGSVAIGVPYIYRMDALQRLLQSANQLEIDTFYIADNSSGNVEDDLDLESYSFDVQVLNLDYHVGQGACRAAIASALEEDYLVVVDSDMELPHNLNYLKTILHDNSDIGGVSGVLIEENRIRSGCRNIYEVPLFLGGLGIEIGIREQPIIQQVSDRHLAFFDYLTNAAMFRGSCLEEYAWDPSMYNMAHEDFYLGHYHQSEWTFACCPEVFFRHYRGTAGDYPPDLKEKVEVRTAKARFLDKWGYGEFIWGKQREWLRNDVNKWRFKYLVKEYVPARYYLLPRRAMKGLID